MEYYDYRDWICWPEIEIQNYAREIAADLSLTAAEAKYLERQMVQRAGFFPFARSLRMFGPKRTLPERETLLRETGSSEAAIFRLNVELNKPVAEPHLSPADLEARWDKVGDGLTAKYFSKFPPRSKMAKLRIEARRKKANLTFTTMDPEIRRYAEDAYWFSNCLPINYGRWILHPESMKPFEGLGWYALNLYRAYNNARRQAKLGNLEGAMWHAYRAGELSAELNIRLVHSETFDKYNAVNSAQKDAAKARKTVSDELRREAYWRFRNAGHKRAEAGRLAGEELGLSEASIRNAFPDSRYPAE